MYEPSLWPWPSRSQTVWHGHLPHDILAHNVASPWHVWLQKVRRFRGSHPDKHSLKWWTYVVASTLNATVHFFSHKTFKLVLNLPSNNTIHLQKDLLSSEGTVESVALLCESSWLGIHDLRRRRAEHVASALERCDTADPPIVSHCIFIAACQVKYTCTWNEAWCWEHS